MNGLLIKLENELKLRNYSIKTTQIYTQISQASIKNMKSPLDNIYPIYFNKS